MDARGVLEKHKGVFVDTDNLFVSTAEARPGVPKLLTGYVNCEVIYPYIWIVRDLTKQLIEPFLDEAEGFICPQTGDIVLLEAAVTLALEAGKQTIGVWADKVEGNNYRIERVGFEAAIRGKKVVVLNDRISQGGTTDKVIAEARRLECEVLGVATLAGVSSSTAERFVVPKVHALCTIDVEAFPSDEIPTEHQGKAIVADLGHGAEFQVAHPDYAGGYINLLG